MDLRDFFRNQKVIETALTLAQTLPRPLGYGLATIGANTIARRKPAMYWRARANMAHVLGPDIDETTLHETTRKMFINAGKYYYDHYRAVRRSSKSIRRMVAVPQAFLDTVAKAQAEGRGVLLIGTHISNFDLGAMAVAAYGMRIQALSLADPPPGFKLLNQLRIEAGFEVTPIAPDTLRQAIHRLKEGGIVATAIDWPQDDDDHLTNVFGKPARVPLGPARLAMMTGAATIMLRFFSNPKTGYGMEHTEPMDMAETGNRKEDVQANTRRMVKILEEYILKAPEQWMMFHPFWASEPDDQPKS